MLYVKSFFSNKLSILVEINVFKEEAIWSHSLVLSLIFSSKCKTLPYVEVETTHNYNGFSNALITTRSSRMNVAPISNQPYSYLIFVTGATGGSCVNFFCSV